MAHPHRRLVAILIALGSLTLASAEAGAQSLDIGVGGTATVSMQLTDETNPNAQGRYRDEPIGGWGPGFGVFLTAITSNGLTISGEFTQTTYSVEHSAESDDPSTLRQSLVSGYLGYTVRTVSVTASFLGGAGWVSEELALTGFETEHPLEPPLAVGGGVEVAIRLSAPLALVTSAKYTSLLGRHETQDVLGMTSHLFRFGVGLRLRVK